MPTVHIPVHLLPKPGSHHLLKLNGLYILQTVSTPKQNTSWAPGRALCLVWHHELSMALFAACREVCRGSANPKAHAMSRCKMPRRSKVANKKANSMTTARSNAKTRHSKVTNGDGKHLTIICCLRLREGGLNTADFSPRHFIVL